jgi:hypothetical protein
METGWARTSLCLVCLGLVTVLTAAGIGQTAVGGGQRGTSSLMDRLQKEEDPELAELIRTAVANHKGASEKEMGEIVRRVTQGHAQILLLDRQIEETARKIESTSGTAEARGELLRSQKELESKRMTELANLREAMGIVPRVPFAKQPTPRLNAWVSLQMLGERVVVLNAAKPFSDYWAMARFKVAGLVSPKETLDYIEGRLKDKKSLPLRIEIYYSPETNGAAEELRQKIAGLAQETKTDMDTELRLELISWVGNGTSPFFLREGRIWTFYPKPVRRPDGGPKLISSGLVDPNDLEQCILWRLTKPKNLPLTFRIEYDEASSPLAKKVADTAKAVATRVGLEDVVGVTGALVEPLGEQAFLGKWQALGRGIIQDLDVQPGGVCQVTVGEGSRVIKAGASVTGTWVRTLKEILVNIGDPVLGLKDYPPYIYRATVGEEGNLVVERGEIWPQGSFMYVGTSPTILRRVP